MPKCPDDTELAGFLNNSLSGEQLSHLSEHVDGCPQCQARLDRLTAQGSVTVERYKKMAERGLPDADSVFPSPDADTHILGRPMLPSTPGVLPNVPGFEVIAEIGRGGMGIVYKARHRRLNRLVALKMILAGSSADPRVVQRFLFEAEVLARVQHSQVVQVFEVDTYQGPNGVPIPYLAMELLEGGSLSRKLKTHSAETGNTRWPTPHAAAELVEGLARAVHAAHCQGVVHRDLKPGNILFANAELGTQNAEHKTKTDAEPETQSTEQKTKTRPALFSRSDPPAPSPEFVSKVTDFGLAKFIEAGADLTHTGQIVGTPQYMAPEQASGAKQIGPQADVYALGAILFECLAGRPPFIGSEPMSVLVKVVNEQPPHVRSLRPDVPRDLAAVTMKCLEKQPDRRYASAEALANDLRRFLDNRPTRARPVTFSEQVWLWATRNPAVASLIAALAVVLVTAFVTVAALWVEAEDKAQVALSAQNDARLAQKRAEDAAQNAAKAQADAQNEAQKATEALREALRQEALLKFDRAVASCEEGRVKEGLQLFQRTAELADLTGQTDLARVARINIAAWPRELPPKPRAFAYKDQPRYVAFHPDGKRFVSVGLANEVYLWDIQSGEKLRTYKPPFGIRTVIKKYATYWSVAISPDGKTIAAGGSDGYVTLWDIDKSEPKTNISAVSAFDGNVWSLAFTSNTVLWALDGGHGLNRWDLSANPPKATRLGPPLNPEKNYPTIQILTLSPNSKHLYTGDRGGWIREWDTEQLKERRAWRTRGWVVDIAISPDQARLAATGTDGLVRQYNLVSGQELPEISLAGAYGNGVAFATHRPYLLASDGDGNLRFWHRDTGQPIGIPMRFQGYVNRPRFRPGTDEFMVPAGDSIYLSSVPDPPGTVLFTGRSSRLRGLSYTPNGLLGFLDESQYRLVNPATGQELQFAAGWNENPLTLHFDPDPARPVAYRGTREGFDRLTVPGGKQFDENDQKHSSHLGRVYRIECLPGDGGLFAMGQWRIARFDPKTLTLLKGKPIDDLPGGMELDAMAVRPDGKELLFALGTRILFLDSTSLKVVREWHVGDAVLDARYTPDGKKILVGRRDNKAELLDAVTGEPASARAMTHTRAVVAVAMSADGTLLVTASRDKTARFWDAATGLPLGAPLRHSEPVTHVAFSPKGDHIATGTVTGQVTTWKLPPPAK